MTAFELVQEVSNIATAIGVGIAAWQLAHSRQQAQSAFEDSFTEQYRRILGQMPLDALLGAPLSEDELKQSLRAFYEYFDLSNEQVFIGRRGRFRAERWANWQEGIRRNMARPAFRQAWAKLLPTLDGSFDGLRELIQEPPRGPSAPRRALDAS